METGNDSQSDDSISSENAVEETRKEAIVSVSLTPTVVHIELPTDEKRDSTKNRTVQQILDEVLNSTIIHVPNKPENEVEENNESAPIEQPTKVVTVKQILGEILQYNIYKLTPSTSSLACKCGKSLGNQPGTSQENCIDGTQTDSSSKDCQNQISGMKVQPTKAPAILKTEMVSPMSVSRVLPSYSAVIRLGPQAKTKSTESFVPKVPPPSYAEVEGIYDDVPSAVSSDSIMYGPDPVYLICPVCRVVVTTAVERETTSLTHWIAFILCIFMCWPCCLLPYYLKSCSYTYHNCPQCGHYFGMYNPF